MPRQSIADHILDDPRGQSESEWLALLKYLVANLSDSTSTCLELGRYWIEDFPNYASAGMGARVRSKKRLQGVESDYWEAAICLTGDSEGAWADAFVIPYYQGSRVTSKGTKAASSTPVEEEVLWFSFVDGEFQNKGWSYPDGPGEWSWVKQPGDEYQQYVDCRMENADITSDAPIWLNIVDSGIANLKEYKNRSRPSLPRLSLLYVNRNREHTNLVPWNTDLPRPDARDAVTINDIQILDKNTLRVDLRAFRIRGGWTPGHYHLSLRVQNFHKADQWSWSSEISTPLKLKIE